MEVKTTQSMMKLPDSFSGKWFVLFSHPADFTPICTAEFVAFERIRPEFDRLNCDLIGLSIDQVFSHMKSTEWIGKNLGTEIRFPIMDEILRAVKAHWVLLYSIVGWGLLVLVHRWFYVRNAEGLCRIREATVESKMTV